MEYGQLLHARHPVVTKSLTATIIVGSFIQFFKDPTTLSGLWKMNLN